MSPKSGVAPLFLLLLSTIVSGDGDNISPESLTDTYGNTADADSSITWAELEEEVYERSDYSDGQLEGFLKMKDNFIKTLKKEMLDPSKLKTSNNTTMHKMKASSIFKWKAFYLCF